MKNNTSFIFLLIFILTLSNCSSKDTKTITDHFDGDVFFNPVDNKTKSMMDVLKWKINSDAVKWPDKVSNEALPELPIPAQLKVGEYAITFINHSAFLIQIQIEKKLINILTDPVFSDRTSPFSFVGPKRVREPGLSLENLPSIDVILVSHNHYDHMDYNSLKKLVEKFNPLIILPLGNSKYLDFKSKPKIIEKDWNQTVEVDELKLKIHIARAHHWSRRSLTDTNKALWCSFVIEGAGKNIYFAGDTGYQNHFKEIRLKFPKISTALLPIGAYAPRWFMKDAHMNPEDAIKAHQDLKPVRSIGIHFGTFQLTDEGIDEPVIELEKAKKAAAVSNFEILKVGETRIFTN